ncbi:uncharacterized protein OCT59_011318 [Rhizophagus irregularis]|uniref:uncharacterized protein n=1 Tax=Rhizophagus irregularis TaxID=588596 RepID=UPI00332745BF|nr:hypothetical protein OCT59_011318 [Rhizophagus irregularis]
MWVVWVGSAGVWSVGVWVGSAGGCGSVGVWSVGGCGSVGWSVGVGCVGVWVGVWEWVVWECGLECGREWVVWECGSVGWECGFIFSPSRSSLSFFTSSFHTNSVLPGTLYHQSTR